MKMESIMNSRIVWHWLTALALLISGTAEASGVGGGGGGDRPAARPLEFVSSGSCEKGPYMYLMEPDPSGNHNVMVRVLYVCADGIYRRNGYVPKYPRCTDGQERMNTERVPRGNHDLEVPVRYVCVSGFWRRRP